MTNTGFQQTSRVRRPMQQYMANGPDAGVVAPDPEDGPDEDAPGYLSPFEQQMLEADNASKAQAQTEPVNDIPSLGIAPGEAPGYAPHAAEPGHYDPEAGWVPDAPPSAIPPARPLPPTDARGMQLIAGPSGVTAAPTGGYSGALNRLEAEVRNQPTMSTPKWWERALASGLGAVAGYSNAASRTRNPIDISKATENIEHPGYAQQLESWRSRIAPLQAEVGIEGQKVGAEQASRKLASEEQLKAAQAEAAMQHGAYWLSRSEQERNQWKMDPKTGILFNTITGKKVEPSQSPKDRYDIAIALHATPAEAVEYSLTGKITPGRTKNEWQLYLDANNQDSAKALKQYQDDKIRVAKASRRPTAGLSDLATEMKKASLEKLRNDELDKIPEKKLADERSIMDKHRQELAQTFGANNNFNGKSGVEAMKTPDGLRAIDAINAKYASQLQNVEDTFASSAARHLNSSDIAHFDVRANPTTHKIEYAPRVPAPVGAPVAVTGAANDRPPASTAPSATPTPKTLAAVTPAPPKAAAPAAVKYPEAIIRQRAIAAGVDPDTAVAAARAHGILQ